MNYVKDKIRYLDFTWNVTPGCTNGCPWCWARRILKRVPCPRCNDFLPHLHPERLGEPAARKKPARIGVSFTGDLFDPHGRHPLYTSERTMRVFAAMMDAPQHTYVLLTKRPDIMFRDLKTWTVSPNWWLLTSVTNQDDADKRIPQLLPLRDAGWLTGVSVEPLLGPVRRMVTQLGWVIIGAQTGPGATVPKEKWVSDMLHECKLGQVPVFVKDNVGWSETIREFPKGDQT